MIVEYVISIVEYTRYCGPLKNALDHLNTLESELERIYQAEADDNKVRLLMTIDYVTPIMKNLCNFYLSLCLHLWSIIHLDLCDE